MAVMENVQITKEPKSIFSLHKTKNEKFSDFRRFLLLLFLSSSITLIVYKTGGTKSAWPQLYFIVIFLAAHYWMVKGGIFVAFALGIITGPLMPLDVSQGLMQTPQNWIIRLLSFMIVGFFAGYILQQNEKTNNRMRERDLIDEVTGLYNTNKLIPDLNEILEKGDEFCLVLFEIKNVNEISKYVSYNIVKRITDYCLSSIRSLFEGNTMYSSNHNEYLLILKDYDRHEINQIISEDLEIILSSVGIGDYSFNLVIKVGIAFNEKNETDALEIIRKARVATSQGESFESGVYIFNPSFDEDKRVFHEISGSIADGINNNEFYVVYQPIINLKDNTISSAEVLARWNRGDIKPVGPDVFIEIAEETGLIQRLSKEIIRQSLNQFIHWEKAGIKLKITVNITANELIDDSFIQWIKEYINEKCIEKVNLGFEITERKLSKDGKKLNGVLSNLHSQGYSVSIDDFGTGHNTLKDLIEMKVDIVKIDKYFIDRIDEKYTKSLIKHLIEVVHERGLLVVAEGVETKEQLIALEKMGCDKIQGYYFSKPLLPDDFVEYYKSFDINKYM